MKQFTQKQIDHIADVLIKSWAECYPYRDNLSLIQELHKFGLNNRQVLEALDRNTPV